MKTILGIDPGSRITGYGIIQSDGLKHHYVTCGSIKVTTTETAARLQQIFDGVRDVIFKYQPETAAVEQVFMSQNPASALILGQARGVAIVVASLHTIPVSEYAATEVKQSVVGNGRASKEQVQHMVCALLKLSIKPEADAADALAVAICHAVNDRTRQRLNSALNAKAKQR